MLSRKEEKELLIDLFSFWSFICFNCFLCLMNPNWD
jgi:hypothetical protein